MAPKRLIFDKLEFGDSKIVGISDGNNNMEHIKGSGISKTQKLAM